jgi:hypothetical protein
MVMTTKSEDTRGTLPFHLDFRAQAAVLADLPESVAREAGNFYEGGPSDLKSDSMQHAWKQVLRPYLIGLRDQYTGQERPVPVRHGSETGEAKPDNGSETAGAPAPPPSTPGPVGWWYEDKHGCILMSLDIALGRRHEAENGAKLNLLYGKPLPGTDCAASTQITVSYDMVERLMEAVEGELDGLAIDAGQALAIMAHVMSKDLEYSKFGAALPPPSTHVVGFSDLMKDGFLTCVSVPGRPFVKVHFPTLQQAQALHEALARAALATTGVKS